jgi:PKD repeat protein
MHRATILLPLAALAATSALTGCTPPPAADFTVAPGGKHLPGDRLTFQLDHCFAGDSTVQWDYDGDGMFDQAIDVPGSTNCKAIPATAHTYDRPGTYTVSSEISERDPQPTFGWPYLHGYSSQRVTIASPPPPAPPQQQPPQQQPPAPPPANQPPTAVFTTDADPAYTERPVHFDAGSSTDSDGQIVKYEWDFDSDGTYDATGATATHAYQPDGTYEATLRVTDDDGATATTQRAISVVNGVPPEESFDGGGGITAARRGTPFSTALTAKLVSPGEAFINGGTLFQAGLTARGSMKLSGLPAPLKHKKRARWAAGFVVKQHGTSDAAKLSIEGYMLLDFGHGDRVCFNGRIAGTPSSQFTGRLGVVGGSGVGRHVRGAATLAVPPDAKQVNGRLILPKTRHARSLPKACKTLARMLR